MGENKRFVPINFQMNLKIFLQTWNAKCFKLGSASAVSAGFVLLRPAYSAFRVSLTE